MKEKVRCYKCGKEFESAEGMRSDICPGCMSFIDLPLARKAYLERQDGQEEDLLPPRESPSAAEEKQPFSPLRESKPPAAGALADAEKLLEAETADLRACGLSAPKIGYLRGIAEAKCSGRINFRALARRPDEEILAELVKLKGVGIWTAEMLLIFALGRPDVLSFRDLGIRRGIMLLEQKETLSAEEFEAFRRRCSPYGTLASLYLWRIKDGGLSIPSRS